MTCNIGGSEFCLHVVFNLTWSDPHVDACDGGDSFLWCGGLGWGGLVHTQNSGEKKVLCVYGKGVGIVVDNILGCRPSTKLEDCGTPKSNHS